MTNTPHIFTQNGQIVTSSDGYALSDQNITPANVPVSGGIYGPSDVYVNSYNGSYSYLGSFFVRGFAGIPVATIISNAASTGSIALEGLNGLTIALKGQYQVGDYPHTVTVTDGITTFTKAIMLHCTADAPRISNNVIWDSAPTNGWYGLDVANSALMCDYTDAGAVVSEATNTFIAGPQYQHIVAKISTTISAQIGAYPATVKNAGGSTVLRTVFFIAREQPPTIVIAVPQIYSNAQIGDVLGTVKVWSDVGVASITIIASDGTLAVGLKGNLTTTAPQTVGTNKTVTFRCISQSGLSTDVVYTYSVAAGIVVAASYMTATVNPLANWTGNSFTTRRVAAIPVIDQGQMPGPVVWRIDYQPYTSQSMEYNNQPRNWQIIEQTGVVSTQVQLRADPVSGEVQHDPYFEPNSVTLRATSGNKICIQTFLLPVSRYVGPLLFVGQGMSDTASSAYQAAVMQFGTPSSGWETLGAMKMGLNVNQYGEALPNFAGATVRIFANADDNYYVNDGNITNNTDRGWYGPASFIGVPLGNKMPYLGGPTIGGLGGGVNAGGKGFLSLNNGDFLVQGLRFQNIHANGFQGGVPSSGYTGCGIRWNANVYGSLTVDQCFFEDCDQGIETGFTTGTVFVKNSGFRNCGGVSVGSGPTHNIYNGNVYKSLFDNILSHRTFNGHTLKNRGQYSITRNSRFYDGERGAASNQIDHCNGGVHIVDNCVVHKGCFAQNPYSIAFLEDVQNNMYPVNTLTVQNSTIIINTPVNGATFVGAIMMQPRISPDGLYSSAASINNKFAGNGPRTTLYNGSGTQNQDGTPGGDGRTLVVTETGSITLATQPALDFTLPFPNQGGIASRAGPFYIPYDGENRNNYINTFGSQIDPGTDDRQALSVSGSPVGTVVFNLTASGAPYFRANSLTDPRIAPYVAGTVWSFAVNAATYVAGLYPVAPAGRYTLTTNADGSATLTVAQILPASLAGTFDTVALVATAPSSGPVVQNLMYIPFVA